MSDKIKKILGIFLAVHFAPLICLVVPSETELHWYLEGMYLNLIMIGIVGFGMFCIWLMGGFTE